MEIQDLTLGEFLQKFPHTRPHINQYYSNFLGRRPIIPLDNDKKLLEIISEEDIRLLEYYINIS